MHQQTQSLASLTPFFQASNNQIKVHMNVVIDWLNQMISPHEPEDDIVYMNGLNKCVTVKDSALRDMDVRIIGCEDSYIYIDASVKFMQISNCVNCTILVAAVSKTCFMDKCENTVVCVASNYLKIGNCVDCTVHSYTQLCPPIIYGDTRNLTMAPHNASYTELFTHLKNADIAYVTSDQQVPPQIKQMVLDHIHYFSKPTVMAGMDQCYTFMQPIDFMKMQLPSKFNQQGLFLCPQEYNEVLAIRLEHFKDIQNKIKGAQLTQDQEKMLHVAIQGWFREWFVQSSSYKPITELVRMID